MNKLYNFLEYLQILYQNKWNQTASDYKKITNWTDIYKISFFFAHADLHLLNFSLFIKLFMKDFITAEVSLIAFFKIINKILLQHNIEQVMNLEEEWELIIIKSQILLYQIVTINVLMIQLQLMKYTSIHNKLVSELTIHESKSIDEKQLSMNKIEEMSNRFNMKIYY